jgi:hypothetical protein
MASVIRTYQDTLLTKVPNHYRGQGKEFHGKYNGRTGYFFSQGLGEMEKPMVIFQLPQAIAKQTIFGWMEGKVGTRASPSRYDYHHHNHLNLERQKRRRSRRRRR